MSTNHNIEKASNNRAVIVIADCDKSRTAPKAGSYSSYNSLQVGLASLERTALRHSAESQALKVWLLRGLEEVLLLRSIGINSINSISCINGRNPCRNRSFCSGQPSIGFAFC